MEIGREEWQRVRGFALTFIFSLTACNWVLTCAADRRWVPKERVAADRTAGDTRIFLKNILYIYKKNFTLPSSWFKFVFWYLPFVFALETFKTGLSILSPSSTTLNFNFNLVSIYNYNKSIQSINHLFFLMYQSK